MGRYIKHLLTAGFGLAALGCGDSSRESSPTSPSFATTASCDLSTARSLVSSIFPMSVRTTANSLIQTIQNAGAGAEAATDAGFDLLALVATYGPGTPQSSSNFANAIIPCQNVGTFSTTDFTGALGPNGAFEVRGGSGDKAAVVSHDVLWGLEPPLDASAVRLTWNNITHAVSSTVTTKRFLAYGAQVTVSGFSTETQVGTIFDWFTVPTLTFDPGVIVGTCFIDNSGSEYLIQHNPAGSGGEIVPGATPSFCPVVSGYREVEGWSLTAVGHRLLDFFRPQPLLAAAIAVGGKNPAGSIGSLSPSAAVDPGLITLKFQGTVANGKTNQQIKFTNGQAVSVSVTPFGKTPMDGAKVRLIATSNLGATVVPEGNVAITQDGIATFPGLKLNKAGGYRLIATLDAFGQIGTAGFDFNNVTSNGFNLKQLK
jgi:hypothetical protein